MKINLGCGTDIRPGYLNIDKLLVEQIRPDLYRQGDVKSLDWLTEDNTVSEILCLDCLEYIPFTDVPQTIANWSKKLMAGGILKIMVSDCYVVAKAFANGQFSLHDYFQITFGSSVSESSKRTVIDMITLSQLLLEAGLTITTKRYEGVSIYLEATK